MKAGGSVGLFLIGRKFFVLMYGDCMAVKKSLVDSFLIVIGKNSVD